jgi:DNA repair exonuclease SbcCD ATPase subunit
MDIAKKCEPCNILFESNINFFYHLDTETHINNMKKKYGNDCYILKDDILKSFQDDLYKKLCLLENISENNYCNVCATKYNNTIDHYNTKIHIKNIKIIKNDVANIRNFIFLFDNCHRLLISINSNGEWFSTILNEDIQNIINNISEININIKKLQETEKINNGDLHLLIKDNIIEIKNISKKIDRIDIDIEKIQKVSNTYNINLQNICNIINKLEEENKKIKDINTLLTSYENLYDKLNDDIQHIFKVIDNLNSKIKDISSQHEKILSSNSELINHNTILTEHQKNIIKIYDCYNDVKKLKELHISDNNKINNLTKQIETLSSTNTQLLDQNTLLTSQINSIITELDKLKKDNERFELQEKYYKDREQKMAQLLNIDTKKL